MPRSTRKTASVSYRMDGYFSISNSDGKRWIFPVRNLRTALCLYQPGGIKGKLVKTFLPLVWRSSLAGKWLHLQRCGRPYAEWDGDIRNAFGLEGAFECAVFEGTPCVHKKATLQIFRGDTILGYVKISDNPDVFRLFQREQRILEALHASGIDEVPRITALTGRQGRAWMLAQTTGKTLRSGTPHEWGPLMERFIARLEQASGVEAAFEQTELFADMQAVAEGGRTVRELVPERYKACFESACGRFQGRMLACCLTHNDFTPWNMYVQDGRLEVFDWEYASFCNPRGMDRCHFLIQSAFFEKKWTPSQVYDDIIAKECEKDICRLYLLSIISRYLRRDPHCADSPEIARWGQLLEMLEK